MDALLFGAASVFHFACDGDLSPGAVVDSVVLHLCLVGLVASGRTLAATGLVLGYLVGVHVPALVATLVEVHDRTALLSVLGSALLALAAPRATIEVAFGADAYDPRTGALRFDAHVQLVVAAHRSSTGCGWRTRRARRTRTADDRAARVSVRVRVCE